VNNKDTLPSILACLPTLLLIAGLHTSVRAQTAAPEIEGLRNSLGLPADTIAQTSVPGLFEVCRITQEASGGISEIHGFVDGSAKYFFIGDMFDLDTSSWSSKFQQRCHQTHHAVKLGRESYKIIRRLKDGQPISLPAIGRFYEDSDPTVVRYLTYTGTYAFYGDVYDTATHTELTAQKRRKAAKLVLETLPWSLLIPYEPERAVRTVFAFVDPAEQFSRKILHDTASYVQLGIKLVYIPFPALEQHRGAVASVLCAPYPRGAFVRAINGEAIEQRGCRDKLAMIDDAAARLSIDATPTLVYDDGNRAAGAPLPAELFKMLEPASSGLAVAAERPEVASVERLRVDLVEALRSNRPRDALATIDRYRLLEIEGNPLPPALLLTDGKLSAQLGQKTRAAESLAAYLRLVPREDPSYGEASSLYANVSKASLGGPMVEP